MSDETGTKSLPVFLPIGSVVTLKNTGQRPFMVYSRKTGTEDGEEFDYLLCPYPEGYIDDDASVLVNAADISGLLFIGFQNKRELEMRKVLSQPLEDARGTWDWTEY